MPPSGPPTAKEILKIARRTTDIIERHVTSNVCLVGSAGAFLWADIGRVPGDVDILVNASSGWDAESIKVAIVEADDRYYLMSSKIRKATHKILFCRLPGWHLDRRCVKVDILIPGGELGFPEIEWFETPRIKDIPVMPLFTSLVMKLQGWWDHRTSEREDFRAKEDADVADIDALLDCAVEQDIWYYDEESAEDRHPPEFMDWACLLARRFVSLPRRRGNWKAIGFPL